MADLTFRLQGCASSMAAEYKEALSGEVLRDREAEQNLVKTETDLCFGGGVMCESRASLCQVFSF